MKYEIRGSYEQRSGYSKNFYAVNFSGIIEVDAQGRGHGRVDDGPGGESNALLKIHLLSPNGFHFTKKYSDGRTIQYRFLLMGGRLDGTSMWGGEWDGGFDKASAWCDLQPITN